MSSAFLALEIVCVESPIGVTSYQFERAWSQEIKSELPSVEELEEQLELRYEELKSPVDKKLNS